jgi:hypothetical protein
MLTGGAVDNRGVEGVPTCSCSPAARWPGRSNRRTGVGGLYVTSLDHVDLFVRMYDVH